MATKREVRNATPQMSDPAVVGRISKFVAGGRVLDVGCGAGLLGFLLRSQFPTTVAYREYGKELKRLDGLDFDQFTIDRLKTHAIYDNLYFADSSSLPVASGTYDCVASLENVEHLFADEVEQAVTQLIEVTADQVLLSTPPPHCCFAQSFPFYKQELDFVADDAGPISYTEYMKYTGWFHKNTFSPAGLLAAGFLPLRSTDGRIELIAGGTCLYSLRKKDFRPPLKLDVFGLTKRTLPRDDARDYRSDYEAFIREVLDLIGCSYEQGQIRVIRQVHMGAALCL